MGNRSNTLNPNNSAYRAAHNNRSNQLNSNNSSYCLSRSPHNTSSRSKYSISSRIYAPGLSDFAFVNERTFNTYLNKDQLQSIEPKQEITPITLDKEDVIALLGFFQQREKNLKRCVRLLT